MHAVVFDIDGTLLQSSDLDDAIYKAAIRAILGNVRFRASLADYAHVSDTGILQQVLDDNKLRHDAHTIGTVKAEFFRRIDAYIAKHGPFAEVSGARKLLKMLQNSENHVVAIATGGWRRSAEAKLRSAGIDTDSIPVASSDDAHERTAIMQTALARLDGRVETITYFGDGEWDELACRHLGWTFRAVGARLGGIDSYEGEYAGLRRER